MPNPASMPLTMATPGRPMRLQQVLGGERCRRRLAELGLTPGVTLSVLQGDGGALVLCVRDTRIAVGRGLAHKLQVVACEECPHSAPEYSGQRKPVWYRGRGGCCDQEPGKK
ncbi:MAG: FeoA family protein [Anaerolineales bacterium]